MVSGDAYVDHPSFGVAVITRVLEAAGFTAAVLAQPWVDIVLSGAAQVQHLESNIQALKVKWDDESDRRLAYLVEPAVEYWQARGRLDWN